jgi:hypothetical protein
MFIRNILTKLEARDKPGPYAGSVEKEKFVILTISPIPLLGKHPIGATLFFLF